jgi:polysaccharide deacetylase family protein (PEP-CTERM system associated)
MKINAMTVDVEDYFHVSAFEPYIPKDHWDMLPHRVEHNTHKILDLFDRKNIKATFFTLGWVAERYPSLIKRIVQDNHELASHGFNHIRVTEQTSEQFRSDVSTTKKLLEDISGIGIDGYRAASYSIGANNQWALAVLQEEGYKYSSSIYPVKHDIYGMPSAPRYKYNPIDGNSFTEIPISTFRFAEKNFPCGGGGFFRFYPYFLSRWALKRINNIEQESAIFYFHPWEIDPDQPRQQGLNYKTRFRHYLNLNRMENRISRLLIDFKWDTMANVFGINS